MNRVVTVSKSTSVFIERFDHPAHCAHRDDDFETTQDTAVTFVESGTFELYEDSAKWAFGAGDVLVSTPGTLRRYRHLQECPDDVCLSISFDPATVEDALGNFRQSSYPPQISRSAATHFAHLLIRSALASGDPLWIEELAFHSLLALVPESWDRRARRTSNTAHTRRIRSAIELMTERFAERCSLTSISREVGMSPFYFARTFSGLVGLSPHQYLLRLRLRRSATMLRQGASVTAAAFSNGFDHLGHFSRSFRRRFGVSPSKYPSGTR
jgi:AraC-like DNA-binding protein